MEILDVMNNNNVLLVDVREPFEFNMGHAKGSLNIPLGQIPHKVEYFKEQNKPIIFYCRSGNRCGQAVAYLKASGVTDIYNGGSVEAMEYYLRRAA